MERVYAKLPNIDKIEIMKPSNFYNFEPYLDRIYDDTDWLLEQRRKKIDKIKERINHEN